MPWVRYQSSPIGSSSGFVRRPRVYTGSCSSRSRWSGSVDRWISSPTMYGTGCSYVDTSRSAIPALEVLPHAREELRRQRAVERAVVPGHAEVGHRPDGDAIPVHHDRPLDDRLEVEDRHLRL